MRILVIRLSAMGDVAMSVPVVGALRKQYPEAQIVVLTPAFLQPFFRGIEALEFVSPDFTGRHKGLKGVLKLSSELGRFDMVADLHDVIRTKMLRRILRLRGAKVAYIDKGREEKKALVALENKKLVQLKTTVERYREVFLALGFDLPPIAVPPRVRYSLDAETEALAGAHEGKKWIGIAPFAQHQGKIYPLEQMERVIAMLSQMPGVRLFVFGGGAAERRSLREGLSGLKEVIAAFFTKRHIWYYIAFIILYRLGEGFVMKIVPLFLKADTASGGLGLTNQQIGLYYGTFGAGAFLLGSLLAGYYIARRGLRRTLFTLCCIFNLPFGVYALLAWFQPSSMWLVGGGIVVEYFGYGFGFVGLTLFMMQQVAPGRHQMAHYAFASGIMNLSVMLTGMASGFLSDLMSYRIFFLAVMLATIPAFVITRLVPFTYDDKPNDK